MENSTKRIVHRRFLTFMSLKKPRGKHLNHCSKSMLFLQILNIRIIMVQSISFTIYLISLAPKALLIQSNYISLACSNLLIPYNLYVRYKLYGIQVIYGPLLTVFYQSWELVGTASQLNQQIKAKTEWFN